MRLYAAGFNAWDQLRFGHAATAGAETEKPGSSANDKDVEPDDVYPFTCVLEAEVQDVRPFITFTSVTTSGGQLVAGAVSGPAQDHSDYSYAEALNGRVVVHDDTGIYQYASAEEFHQQEEAKTPCTPFSEIPGIVQVVAYDTGFAALTTGGQVWTWGDSRFPGSLGRDVSEESPADRPGQVTCLNDLPTGPIVKIAAGGYVLAALTRGHDLYCWGGYPGRKPVLEDLTSDPAPIVVVLEGVPPTDMDDVDILDVGVGEAHMVVLTAAGHVCGIGSNANGQLGMDPNSRPAVTSSWARIDLPLLAQERVVGVTAGPRCSFVLVDKQ